MSNARDGASYRRPRISCLMPCYNAIRDGGSWLGQCVDSILSQTMSDFEFVIVDDGSTDGTWEVLEGHAKTDDRIRLIRIKPNGGITGALNLGLASCQAPLIARQDADDYSAVTRFEVQLSLLDNNPHLSLVGSDFICVDEAGRVLGYHARPSGQSLHDMMPIGCPLAHGSVMFRLQHVVMLGGYDPNGEYRYAEDYHLWARIHMAGLRMDNSNKPLYMHRNHPTKSSRVFQGLQADSTRRIREMLKT